MTIYEMIKKYSSGKGEGTMWKTVEIISRAIDRDMPEDKKVGLVREIYRAMSDGHYNEDFAREDISKMFYEDKSGNRHEAPYWSEDAIRGIYDSVKEDIPGYNCWDFAVTMNNIASTYLCLIKDWFPNATSDELDDKMVDLAITWLTDDNVASTTRIWDKLNK